MGEKEKEISDSRKMKLALSFCVFYSASAFQSVDWNDGKNEDMGNPCGSFVQFDEPEDFGEFSVNNSTCKITYKMASDVPHIKHAFVGGGAFIESPATRGFNELSVFGFPGITSESFDMVIFWDSSFQNLPEQFGNETCGSGNDFALQCTSFDTYDPLTSEMDGHFMETVNDFRKSEGDRLDFQVIGPKAHELITIELKDSQGENWPCLDFTASYGIAPHSGCAPSLEPNSTALDCGSQPGADNFILISDDYFVSTLLGFSCTMFDDSIPDLWQSQVSRQPFL